MCEVGLSEIVKAKEGVVRGTKLIQKKDLLNVQ